MALFRDMVCYRKNARCVPRRRSLNRCSPRPSACRPAQINIPRDFWTQVVDVALPAMVEFERPAGGATAIAKRRACSRGELPCDPFGRRRVIGHAIGRLRRSSRTARWPVCSATSTMTVFPAATAAVGPLGYNGSKPQ